MFRTRSKLQRRDQDSGLVFSWRVPLTSTASFVVAVVLMVLFSAGLAAFVRVKVGSESVRERQHASMVLVHESSEGRWLEAMAIEAGPFPSVWNPAADPAYAALRGQALRQATGLAIPYMPEPVPLELIPEGGESGVLRSLSVFPPLPEVLKHDVESDEPKETTLGIRVVRTNEGPTLQLPRLPLEAKDAVAVSGRRFLVGYEDDGKVREVIPFKADETPADLIGWIGRARVLEHGDRSGWLPVETTVEP